MHLINTGFEKLGVMGLLPDASIIVSDQNYQNLRPTLKMYQAKTGKLLYKSFDANVPDGMAVVTAANRQYLALSYWSVKILVCELITVRNEVAKVMFLHLSVHRGSASVHAGIPSPGRGHPPDQAPPPPGVGTPLADGYCCGRYASYWNAFLLKVMLRSQLVVVVILYPLELHSKRQ